MESLLEFMVYCRNQTVHRIEHGSLREKVPYELYTRGYDLLVFWRSDYHGDSHEFAWVLVKDSQVVKEWDRCPTLSDLFDIQKEVLA